MLFPLFSPWKYVINIAGSELPLYSVDELAVRLEKSDVKIATDSYKKAKFAYRQKQSYFHDW